MNNAKQIIPVQEDYISTQQKGKSVCEIDSENDGDVGSDVDPAMDSDEEMEYLSQKLIDMKRKRSDPSFHFEGDTEEEENSIYNCSVQYSTT